MNAAVKETAYELLPNELDQFYHFAESVSIDCQDGPVGYEIKLFFKANDRDQATLFFEAAKKSELISNIEANAVVDWDPMEQQESPTGALWITVIGVSQYYFNEAS